VLQVVAVCCSQYRRGYLMAGVLQCVAAYCSCCSLSPCVAVNDAVGTLGQVFCSVLQRVAACCRVLQSVAVFCSQPRLEHLGAAVLQRVAASRSVLQRVAACCSVMQSKTPWVPWCKCVGLHVCVCVCAWLCVCVSVCVSVCM